ncbi:MAG: hypothetical protein B6241_10590 [Spirochaetaceae bacterium 4572_59]|nr:MAG: hypothetical protein B6241_10590 [Spirochaetaceae bacterium 4572_59]
MSALNPYVVFQNDSIVVAEKPAGLLSVPGRGPEKADCLFSRLLKTYPELLIVHRLDQATSGLMIWARTKDAQRALGRQFEMRLVQKRYEALVAGELPGEEGTIRLKQRLDPENRPLQLIDPELGKEGITEWNAGEILPGGLRRVSLSPHTGRTHQLRLHMASLFCPIAGDSLYGDGKNYAYGRMCLHACYLEVNHPTSGERLVFQSRPPF